MTFAHKYRAILLAPNGAKWDNKKRAPVAYLAIRDQGSRHHFDYTERG